MSFPVMDPAHFGRHQLKPHHAARESLSYMLQLPEEGLAGFVYTWVDGQGLAGAALCFYGPAVGEVPLFELVDGLPVHDDRTFRDWHVGGLQLEHGERTTGTYIGKEASIQFSFEGVHPAYNYGAHPDGALPWMADDRYEQSGRWKGTLNLRGREIAFDTISHRDQSWGIRDWGMCQHYRWLQANAGPDCSVNFTQDYVLGHVNVRGYVFKNGVMAQITALECDYELRPDMVHTSLDAVIQDDAGRTTTLHGRTYAWMEFPFPPTTTLVVCSDEIEIDGHPGRGQFDLLWASQYVDYVREHGLPSLPAHPPREKGRC